MTYMVVGLLAAVAIVAAMLFRVRVAFAAGKYGLILIVILIILIMIGRRSR